MWALFKFALPLQVLCCNVLAPHLCASASLCLSVCLSVCQLHHQPIVLLCPLQGVFQGSSQLDAVREVVSTATPQELIRQLVKLSEVG